MKAIELWHNLLKTVLDSSTSFIVFPPIPLGLDYFVPCLALLLPRLRIAALTILLRVGRCPRVCTRILSQHPSSGELLVIVTQLFCNYKYDRILQVHVVVVMSQYILLDAAVAKSNEVNWVLRAVFENLQTLAWTRKRAPKLLTRCLSGSGEDSVLTFVEL